MPRRTTKRLRGGWSLSPGRKFRVKPATSPQTRTGFTVEEALREGRSKIAKSKVTPGVRAALADQRYDQIKEKPKPKRATMPQVQNEPVFMPKVNKDGSMQKPNYPGIAIYQKMGKSVFKGIMSSETLVFEDQQSPPRPMVLEYEMFQTGSSKYLRERKKEWGSTSQSIPLPRLTVNGDDPAPTTGIDYLIQNTTMCGFGRAGVHYPYAWHDYVAPNDSLTAQQGCFTRQQLRTFVLEQLKIQSPTTETPAQLEELLGELLDQEGDIRQYFPFESVECEYKYVNNNLSLPMRMSLYVNTPTRDLPIKNDPLHDWFQPFTTEADADQRKMPVRYRYNPVTTAANDLMYDVTNAGVVQNPDFTTNTKYNSILTASTEVVSDATPMGFSQRFRDHWNTLTMQHLILQPQQELIVKFKVHLSQMLDCRRFLKKGTGGQSAQPQFFEELTLFPIVKFWGADTIGVSQTLVRDGITQPINNVIESTAPRSGPCLLSESQTCKIRARINAAKRADNNSLPTWQDWFLNFSTKDRILFDNNSVNRGAQVPYHKCNNNVGIFCNKSGSTVPTPPVGSSSLLSTLCELDTSTSTVSPVTGPTVSQIIPGDYVRHWDYTRIETVARTTSRRTQSEISAST